MGLNTTITRGIQLFLLLITGCAALGQETTELWIDSSGTVDFSRYSVRNYTSANGLLQNTVKHLMFDSQGQLWLQTERGLSSFDGNNFEDYEGDRFRRTLMSKGQGSILMGDGFDVVDGRLRDYKGERYPAGCLRSDCRDHLDLDDYPLNVVEFIGINRRLIKASNSTLYAISGDSIVFIRDTLIQRVGEIKTYREDRLFRVDGRIFFTRREGPSHDGFIYELENGKVKRIIEAPLLKGDMSLLWQGEDHKVFLNGSGSMFAFVLKNGRLGLQWIVKKHTLPIINCISVDELDGLIFIGTSMDGFYVLQPKGFEVVTRSGERRRNNLYGILQIGRDSVLTGTGLIFAGDSAYYSKNNLWNIVHYQKNLISDSWGRVWSDIDKDTHHRLVYWTPESEFNDFVEPFPGWYFPKGSNISRVNDTCLILRNGSEHYIITMDQIGKAYIHSKLDLKGGENVDFDEQNGLLLVLESRNPRKYYLTDLSLEKRVDLPELHNMIIKVVIGDVYGGTWIFTRGDGTYYYREKLYKLPSDPARAIDYAHCMVEHHGTIWLSSNNGILQTTREEVEAYLLGKSDQLFYHLHNQRDGIESIELNGGCKPCGIVMEDDEIAFPSLVGLVRFNANNIRPMKSYRGTFIKKVFRDGSQINEQLLSEGLKQDFDRLEFIVTAPFYGKAENNSYIHYRLRGLSDNWYPVGADNRIVFSKLSHGDYELQIRRKNGFGLDNFSLITQPLKVRKYAYQTTSFKVVIGIGAILLWIMALRVRTALLKRNQKALEDQVKRKTEELSILNEELKLMVAQLRESQRDVALAMKGKEKMLGLYVHDVRGPLRYVSDLARQLQEDQEEQGEEQSAKALEMIAKANDRIYYQTEKMFNWLQEGARNNWIQVSQINLYEVVQSMIQIFEGQAAAKNNRLINKVPPDVVIYTDTNLLQIALNNITENAIKFTEAGTIRFDFHQLRNYYNLRISDSGRGIGRETLDRIQKGLRTKGRSQGETGRGYGLSAVKVLLADLGSYMEIESEEGKGTVVSLFIKISDQTE